MFRVFAKQGTSEKLLIPVPQERIQTVMQIMEERYGGSWVYVDDIKPGEGLIFNDQSIYRGFINNETRYFDKIIFFEKTFSGFQLKEL